MRVITQYLARICMIRQDAATRKHPEKRCFLAGWRSL